MASHGLLILCFTFITLMWLVGISVVELPPAEQRFQALPPQLGTVFRAALSCQDHLVIAWGDLAIGMIDTSEGIAYWMINVEQSILNTMIPSEAANHVPLKELRLMMGQIFGRLKDMVNLTVNLTNRLNHQSTVPFEKVLVLFFRIMDSILGVPPVQSPTPFNPKNHKIDRPAHQDSSAQTSTSKNNGNNILQETDDDSQVEVQVPMHSGYGYALHPNDTEKNSHSSAPAA
eukprot:gb/GEZN01016192.1/.p1 GENE.gb/GEZN01016192.1/~~gb/GEZN01016192.1/.p1  ORF type:complete len:231 (+),score=16.66 gb/GEZN01016192.1/:64-756(+)